jgi:hypothetical protein
MQVGARPAASGHLLPVAGVRYHRGPRGGANHRFLLSDIERYRSEKEPIMAKARKLEEEASEFDRKSDELMHQHHRWAQATTALQVSIATAAIALLARRRWLEWAALGTPPWASPRAGWRSCITNASAATAHTATGYARRAGGMFAGPPRPCQFPRIVRPSLHSQNLGRDRYWSCTGFT